MTNERTAASDPYVLAHRSQIEAAVQNGVAVKTLIRATGVWIHAEVKPLPFFLDWDNYDYRLPEARAAASAGNRVPSREEVEDVADSISRLFDLRIAAGMLRDLLAEVERLNDQLPDRMKRCTIQFKECERGHGWLTATNWIQRECQTCERDTLRATVAQQAEALAELQEHRRWNIERDGDALLICEGDHDKSQGCQYIRYIREDAALASQPKDKP